MRSDIGSRIPASGNLSSSGDRQAYFAAARVLQIEKDTSPPNQYYVFVAASPVSFLTPGDGFQGMTGIFPLFMSDRKGKKPKKSINYDPRRIRPVTKTGKYVFFMTGLQRHEMEGQGNSCSCRRDTGKNSVGKAVYLPDESSETLRT